MAQAPTGSLYHLGALMHFRDCREIKQKLAVQMSTGAAFGDHQLVDVRLTTLDAQVDGKRRTYDTRKSFRYLNKT